MILDHNIPISAYDCADGPLLEQFEKHFNSRTVPVVLVQYLEYSVDAEPTDCPEFSRRISRPDISTRISREIYYGKVVFERRKRALSIVMKDISPELRQLPTYFVLDLRTKLPTLRRG